MIDASAVALTLAVFVPKLYKPLDKSMRNSAQRHRRRWLDPLYYASLPVALLLGGCEQPTTADHAPGPGTIQRSNLPPALAALPLDCTPQVEIDSGAYRAENNTWGAGELRSYSQCIALGANPDGDGVIARWNWDWPQRDGNVKAYPAVIFGQKPGHPSTDARLPAPLAQLQQLRTRWRIDMESRGRGNSALDLWLTDRSPATSFAVPPISHEIMIWLHSWGDMPPGGSFHSRVKVGGLDYELWTADGFGLGWRYITFKSVRSQLHSQQLDLLPFLDAARAQGLITGEEYLASVEFGNEPVYGSGETRLLHYAVDLKLGSATP